MSIRRFKLSHTQHCMYDIDTMRTDQHDYTFVNAEDFDDLQKRFDLLQGESEYMKKGLA